MPTLDMFSGVRCTLLIYLR